MNVMPDAAALLAFAGLCAILAITPGPDTFLVLRYGHDGVAAGLAAAAGSAIGSLVWAGSIAVGLNTLVTTRPWALTTLQVVGGLYLLYVGVAGIVAVWRDRHRQTASSLASRRTVGFLPAFRAGLASCVLNPKVGLFFLAVAPQFLTSASTNLVSIMLLGAIDAVVATIWLTLLAVAAARAGAWLRRPRVATGLGMTTSGILAALGIGTIANAAR